MKKIFLISFILLFYVLNILLIFFSTQDANLRISGILTATFIYVLVFYLSIKLLRKSARLVNILFLNVIILIVMQGLINFDYFSKESKDENRVLADFPKLSPFHEDFAEKTDRYIDDRVGMRIQAGKAHSYIAKNDYDFNQRVVEGRDGWLFYNDENDDYDYFSGIKKFKQENIEKVINAIKENKEFCDKNGIKLIIAIPPNKSTVYPEYYNKYINKVGGNNNYIKFKQELDKSLPKTDIVFLYASLMDGKKNGLMYYKKGSHWTSMGAYTAYQEISNIIEKYYPKYVRIADNETKKCNKLVDVDLSYINKSFKENSDEKIEGICPNFKEEILKLKYTDGGRIESNIKAYGDISAPKILLIHDSFMVELGPFIEKKASKISSIWYTGMSFDNIKDEILKIKPDIIIWEKVERSWYK